MFEILSLLCIFKAFSLQKQIAVKLFLLLESYSKKKSQFQSQPPTLISRTHSKLKIAPLQSITKHKKFWLERRSSICLAQGTTMPEQTLVAACLNEKHESEHVCCIIFAKMERGPQRRPSSGNWINEQAVLCRP